MWWFSKCPKLSKKQYEEARNSDKAKKVRKFKVHTKKEWWILLKELQEIKIKYYIRDCHHRYDGVIFDDYSRYYDFDIVDKNESWFYYVICKMLNYIGDGWGRDFTREEILYITDDFVMPATEHKRIEELYNGDLLVKDDFVVKENDTRKITEIDTTRYEAGTWKKKIVESKYDKQLLDDADYLVLKFAEKYCIEYEIFNNIKGLRDANNSCKK